jgi:NADPH2:quinone reductase
VTAERAIEIDRYGGPDELVWRPVTRPCIGAVEVRIRTSFAAVNRADVEIRRGEWPIVRDSPFPYTPGLEVVGEVESVGGAVAGVAVGDRVVTMMQHLAVLETTGARTFADSSAVLRRGAGCASSAP